jgi:hypothetical protein
MYTKIRSAISANAISGPSFALVPVVYLMRSGFLRVYFLMQELNSYILWVLLRQ